MIPNTNMEILQSYSDKCWEILHTQGCIFEVEDLSKRLPAFLAMWGEQIVYVKYPTFKIQIFNGVIIKKVQIKTRLKSCCKMWRIGQKCMQQKRIILLLEGKWSVWIFPMLMR